MGKLRVLPVQLANMIAAGEVVQRPASVVKELMENAVDADASQINVIVTDAGRTLIQVIDNGSGMSPDDAVLCFERHSTSKISSVKDLNEINTYGFRGEALASIAAVAEVTLKTRHSKDDTATEVRIEDAQKFRTASISAPIGSNFIIRNLFYNTPARRKFLKSDNVELKHIVEEFTRVAVTRPEIEFTLKSNGREIFVLKKAKSLKFRILDLLGNNLIGDIVDLSAQTSVVKISGFVGRPDSARKTLCNQFFFVNGRYFRSAYLHKAVMKAYEELIPEGVTPSYFIFLEIDPHAIDVNIHPTKAEVKFEDDSVIFQILYACVKETLGRNSFGASINFDTEGAVELPQLGKSFEEYKGVSIPEPQADPFFDPFNSGSFRPVEKNWDNSTLFEDKIMPSTRILIVQNKYIITPVASGLMVINISRARERIIYEQAMRALSHEAHLTQTALFPVQVQVGVQQKLIFDENESLLSSLGFDISAFGTDTIVVGGVPEGYSCEPGKIQQLVSDLVYILSENVKALPELMQQRMAEKFATLGASNASPLNSVQEAQRLIDTLFASKNAEQTSNGRRIISIVEFGEIEKRF